MFEIVGAEIDDEVSNAMFLDAFGYQWMLHQMHKVVSFEERKQLWEDKRDRSGD